MLWIIFASLALLAAICLLLPLRSLRSDISGRTEGSVSILSDQLHEVRADAERGLITKEEARAALIEIKRRILSLERKSQHAEPARSARSSGIVVWATALMVPLAAGALYMQLGSPDLPSLAFAEREAEQNQQVEITGLTERLLARLQSDPGGGPTEGWMLLGQTYMRMGRYRDAVSAMENVTERPDATSAILSQYAEAMIAVDDGIVTPAARKAIAAARDMDPSNPAATYYEAIALNQAGDSEAAHDLLTGRLGTATGPAPWMEAFIAQANRIGETLGRDLVSLATFAPTVNRDTPGPTAADLAASADMSEQDRSTFVRSMVTRLAERLQDEPNDLDGWMRLGNAYRVLGEMEKARAAYAAAERLTESLPSGDPRVQRIRQALTELRS
ncbi:c-type cytochrome biogenesis protein CcmI [Aliiroseovarius sp. F47248L]|uniref:c-type cytochrome biogenesis protein CcmI n=1 Tax=Aliiroseovarius sp. F47248L TaxID=2926420 RepID=UPI001FF16B4B|nr:c-type cytochrome biogenesis protein CcmI [Aliiroseovarius sp. F47248L]MCK0137922.1 c-type cytochrome biogenesis protein CcmI [Aliiroseovarius sp. F47248L]